LKEYKNFIRNLVLESQRKIGHKVGRKKVYVRTIFYFEALERLIKRSE